ncbi:putative GPI anchored cell wall protein [Aspergillus foveolatus]|uniref:putative GPI anchored cell wall protein n=1 Tax=Aspergillus foveolatus TaxID=210207 RepID=UPI003CCE3970
MLFAKSTVFVTLFALSKVVAAAGTSTPACLLTVVGPENPGDLKAICKTNGDEIQTSIRDVCGDDAKDALNYYAGVCENTGYEVDISSSSSTTSSQTSTKTPDTESSTSGSATSTDGASSTSGSDTDSDSNSGSASASTTDSADTATPTNGGSTDKQVSAAAFAAVVFLGFAATL